jgi:hypothetical protein
MYSVASRRSFWGPGWSASAAGGRYVYQGPPKEHGYRNTGRMGTLEGAGLLGKGA